jgi:predicted AlkP superfamily phosphohydrolase/phosphomutase
MDKDNRKVLVIGLDGATFDLIKPWVKNGHLPNIKKFFDNGTIGNLKSTMPPMTSPAWPSMITGKHPAGHGCFDFTKKVDKKTGDVGIVSSLSIHSESLWTLLSNAGKTIGVMNVPVTYPPQKVKGFLISGLLTPNNNGASYPEGIIEEIREKLKPYQVHINVQFREGNEKAFFDDVLSLINKREETALWLMKNKPWDFFFLVFSGTDSVSHFFWKYMDKNHPQYKGNDNGFNDAILRTYQRVDLAIGHLVKEAGEDANIFLVSDHGSGPLHKSVNINIFLKQKGLLVMKKSPKTMVKRLMFRMGFSPHQVYKAMKTLHLESNVLKRNAEERNKAINTKFLSFDDIDWERTKAFSRGHFGQIFINADGEEYDKVLNETMNALYDMKDPKTKRNIVTKIIKRKKLHPGQYIKNAPDLMIIMKDYEYFSYPFFASSNSIVLPQIGGFSGQHRMHGIFCAVGPDIKMGQELQDLSITDFCPTLLHLFGIPVPEDMDGMVRKDLYIQESGVYARKVKYQKAAVEDKMGKIIKNLRTSGRL